MFDKPNNRYMTSAIAEEVHVEIAQLTWRLIDSKKHLNISLDYLQVFELKKSNGRQAIIHRQEVPEKKSFHLLPLKQTVPITRSIWCIDR